MSGKPSAGAPADGCKSSTKLTSVAREDRFSVCVVSSNAVVLAFERGDV